MEQQGSRPASNRVKHLAIAAGILGTVVVVSIVAFVLLAGLLFMDSPGGPQLGTGEPQARSATDGDYTLDLMETRYYMRGREIETTGFALVIMSKQPFPRPGPDETFIYLDITVRNATNDTITFAPAEQFWLEDSDGRTVEFPVYALREEYSEVTLDGEDHPLGTITLAAHSEVPILFETVITQDSSEVVLVFDPDPAQTSDELILHVPR